MANSKHLSADSSAPFRSLPDWEESMASILLQADKHGLTVDVHILTPGKGEEQELQRKNIYALIRKCVETAYGRQGGLTPLHFSNTRFVITLSREEKTGADEVVGVIVADYKQYFFDLGFECVAEHMRRKGLATLLFNAADTVIQCLARDMASRKELPTTRSIYVTAHTDLDAPKWVEDFTQKMGYTALKPYDPVECFPCGNVDTDDSDITWGKRLDY